MSRCMDQAYREQRIEEVAARVARMKAEHRQRVERRVTKVGERSKIDSRIRRLQRDVRYYRKKARQAETDLSHVRGCCICHRWRVKS